MKPEHIIEVCVAIDIAILSIAYPIIVDKISQIGEKYSSQYIPVLFENEFPQKKFKIKINNRVYQFPIFKSYLYITLFSLTFLIFSFQPLFGWNNWTINNSADLLIFGLSFVFILLFFSWLDKVVLYNGKSTDLLIYIINEYNLISNNTPIKQYHLKAINEFTYYAISRQDEHLQETLLNFYQSLIYGLRKNHDRSKSFIYPIDIYFLINKVNYISVNTNNIGLKSIEHKAASGIWLLVDDYDYIPISNETYNWLWNNIQVISDNSRLVKSFWANSSQYFDHQLDRNSQWNNIEIEDSEIQKSYKIEKNQFLEFHYALGGLLLYKKQYDVLTYLFQFTQYQPPKYALLPKSMYEIFDWFVKFNSQRNLEFNYPYPGLDNLGNSKQIQVWICRYIAILYLRQFTLLEHYVFQKHTSFTQLPHEIWDLNLWQNSINYFKICLEYVVALKPLMEELGFEKLVKGNKDKIFLPIEKLRGDVKLKISQLKTHAELSIPKIEQFYTKSSEIISEAFSSYKQILSKKDKDHEESDLIFTINGQSELFSKSDFTDKENVVSLNFDTILAIQIVKNKIRKQIPNSFLISKTKRYVLQNQDVVSALNKIVENNLDLVFIGVNISSQVKDELNLSFEERMRYIHSTENYFHNIIFVINKYKLPAVEHLEISKEEVDKYQYKNINKDLCIYASVVDINKNDNKSLKVEWNIPNERESSELEVLVSIGFISKIYWKKGANLIQVNIASSYDEYGIVNTLNEVVSFRDN